jgi:hypothetical protein
MSKTIDLGKRHDHGRWAKYLPAISGFYTTHLGKDLSDPTFIPKERVPAKFEHGIQGLNFLDPINSYYHYPYGLFSAGHAERKLDKCDDREPMIHKRDRNSTVIIGDSGGFQIATGVIKLDWTTVKTPAGDKLRGEILKYLEHTADWSMTLDVPAFAWTPPFGAKTGLTCFEDCLDVTEYNLKYFMDNRTPGATKFLNVLSGSDSENSKTWYERVIPYSMPEAVEAMGYTRDRTLEGYAFAGCNMRQMKTTLSRILDLRDDNMLAGKDWIHFLGIGRLDWACYLTSIERQLKKHDNPNLSISFDAASPFVAAGGYALSYDYTHFSADRLTYSMGKGIDNKAFKHSKDAMPYGGPINSRLTTGDVCVMGPGDLNKHGKEGKTSWDTTSYALVMAHNVFNHIEAVQEINRLADVAYAKLGQVDPSDWYQHKGKKKVKNKDDFVPNNILYFNSFVEKLLDPATPNPRVLLEEYTQFLESISFGNKKTVTTLGDESMWHKVEELSVEELPDVQDMADMDDEHLIDADE